MPCRRRGAACSTSHAPRCTPTHRQPPAVSARRPSGPCIVPRDIRTARTAIELTLDTTERQNAHTLYI